MPRSACSTLLSRALTLTGLVGALLAPLAVTAAPADAATTGAQAVTVASHYAGAPYRYGATGPSRFDCSGYTRYVYGRLGRSLPHSSTQQYSVTRHVSRTSKQPGDLIFTRSGGRITHVGIYAGGGQFWDAPKSGDHVRKRKIFTSDYVVGRV